MRGTAGFEGDSLGSGRAVWTRMEGLQAWGVVLGTVAGLTVGNFPVLLFAFSTLLKPTTEATGLSRSELTFAFLIGNIVTMVALPFYGRLIDRFGVRGASVPTIVAW